MLRTQLAEPVTCRSHGKETGHICHHLPSGDTVLAPAAKDDQPEWGGLSWVTRISLVQGGPPHQFGIVPSNWFVSCAFWWFQKIKPDSFGVYRSFASNIGWPSWILGDSSGSTQKAFGFSQKAFCNTATPSESTLCENNI